LIASGANVNQVDNYKDTPLFIAACYGHVGIVDTLLANGADLTKKNYNQDSPLLIASYKGYDDIVSSLLAKGDNANQVNTSTDTCLHLAAANGHVKAVKVLISNNANVNQTNKQGKTPLFSAAENGHGDIVTIFLKHGADVKQEWKGKEALKQELITAVKNADTETIKTFAKQNKGWLSLPIDEYPHTLMHLAVYHGNVNVIHLIANSNNVNQCNKYNQYNFSPLRLAIHKESSEVVKLLLDKGANINDADRNGFTPLHHAIDKGNSEVVQLLLDRGANINDADRNGFTPLHQAIDKGNSELVQLLLDRGADVNKENKKAKKTILSMAAEKVGADLVSTLLKYGADVKQEWKGKEALKNELITAVIKSDIETIEKFAKQNIGWLSLPLDENSKTVLHIAAEKGYVVVLNKLFEYGVDVNTTAKDNNTPLLFAAYKGHNEAVKKLLALGANANLITLKGNSPLFYASQNNHVEVVKTLLANGAKVNQLNNAGHTSLDVAVSQGNTKLVEELLSMQVASQHKNTAIHVAAKHGHLSTFNTLLKSGAEFNLDCVLRLDSLEELLSSLPEFASIGLDDSRILNKLKNASVYDTARILSTLQPETLIEYEKKLYKNSRWDECFNSSKYDGFFQCVGAYLFDGYKATLDNIYYNKVFKKMDELTKSDRVCLSKGHIYAYGLLGQTQNLNKSCEYYRNVSNDNPKNRIYALYELANIYLVLPDKNQEYIEMHKELGSLIDAYLKKHPEDGHIGAMKEHYLGLELPVVLNTFIQDNEARLANAKIEYVSDEELDKQWNKEYSAQEQLSSNPNGFLGTLNQKLAKEEVLKEEESDSNSPKIGQY